MDEQNAEKRLRTMAGDGYADDGKSRPFGGNDLKSVIAEAIARYDGWGETRPGHRWQAAAIARAIKEAGFEVKRSRQ